MSHDRPMPIRSLILVGVLVCWSGAPSDAEVCVEPKDSNSYDWDAYPQITVYIHEDLAENLERSEGVKWTQTELRREIESSVLSFQEQLAVGHPRIVVSATYSNVGWGQPKGPGTIHLAPWLDQECMDDIALMTGHPAVGALIRFTRSGPGYSGGGSLQLDDCNAYWNHYLPPPSRAFRPVLLHEVMHAFGNKHPQGGNGCTTYRSCPAPAIECSCGGNAGTAVHTAWNCHKHDQQRLQDAGHGDWGSISATERHRESFDGLTWSSLAAPSAHPPWPGLSSASLSYLFLARRRPDYVNTYTQLYRWVFTTQVWEVWGYVQGTNVTSLGNVDVAYGGSPAYPYVGHAGVDGASDPLREIYVTKLTAPSTRTKWSLGSNLTSVDGVSIDYHAPTGHRIIVWRDDDLGINLNTVTSAGVFGPTYELNGFGGAREVAAEAPSIACGPAAAGTHPCVLVWAAPIGVPVGGTNYQVLRWIHVGVDANGVFTWGTLMQQGYVMYGPPSVAYNGPTTSGAAFALAWRGPTNDLYYTIGKPVTETAYWDTGTYRSHSGSVFGFSPTLGAAGGAYELVEQSR